VLVASVGVEPGSPVGKPPREVVVSVHVVSTDDDSTTVTTDAECVTNDVWTFVTALVLV
jgi:hypothetical protein